ncbi:sodium:calcium antiporter [Bdellovibrionota bacterium]
MLFIWVQFVICCVLIVFSGTRITYYGDVLAEKTKLGRLAIGMIFLAFATSLPELITGITSIVVYDVPEIAVGDVLGSCVFNLAIMGVLFFFVRTHRLKGMNQRGDLISGSFGLILLATAAVNLFFGAAVPSIGWVGLSSFVFIFCYFIVMHITIHQEKRKDHFFQDVGEELKFEHVSHEKAWGMFLFHALIIVAASSWLPHVGKEIATAMGWEQSLVGSIFIALSTSLPELVITIAAIKIGAFEMAFGNLFGSNLFDLLILGVDDILFGQAPILAIISQNHLISIFIAMAMTVVAMAGITYRAAKKIMAKKTHVIPWDGFVIMALYAYYIYLHYSLS